MTRFVVGLIISFSSMAYSCKLSDFSYSDYDEATKIEVVRLARTLSINPIDVLELTWSRGLSSKRGYHFTIVSDTEDIFEGWFNPVFRATLTRLKGSSSPPECVLSATLERSNYLLYQRAFELISHDCEYAIYGSDSGFRGVARARRNSRRH